MPHSHRDIPGAPLTAGAPTPAGAAPHRGAGRRFRNPWDGPSDRRPALPFAWWVLRRVLDPRWWAVDRARFSLAQPSPVAPRAAEHEVTVTWVGHSTVLVQLGGVTVLTDPIWSERASPLPFAGPARWVAPGIPIDALPPVDVILLSHDHYDHLDARSVRRLAARAPEAQWCAPLGMGRLLRAHGAARVAELDWWGETAAGDARIVCTPARHASGRGGGRHDRTLWCGWAVAAHGRRLFFAGDTGAHPAFNEIGARLGPFDVVLLPIGAYAPRRFFRTVHMDPEDAVHAYLALHERAADAPRAALVPIHWGTFRLTDEPMDEPPRRLRAAWERAGLPAERLRILAHGETARLA